MPRILVVDDNAVTVHTFAQLLRSEGHEAIEAQTAASALAAATTGDLDVALIDLRLPDMSGIDLARRLTEHQNAPACIIITGFGTCRSVIDAMHVGVCDFLEKPVSAEELSAVIRKALVLRLPAVLVGDQCPESHSAKRWAEVVMRVTCSPTDPRTLTEWGRAVGASCGALRNWCRTARISARRSLLFARMLRAVLLQTKSGLPAYELLNVVDRRTLDKIIAASGGSNDRLPGSVTEFLQKQKIVVDPLAVREVIAVLDDARRKLDDAPVDTESRRM